jgi:hypothetical protein
LGERKGVVGNIFAHINGYRVEDVQGAGVGDEVTEGPVGSPPRVREDLLRDVEPDGLAVGLELEGVEKDQVLEHQVVIVLVVEEAAESLDPSHNQQGYCVAAETAFVSRLLPV